MLIHCGEGRSPAAAVVMAYLMWKEGISWLQAFDSVNNVSTFSSLAPREDVHDVLCQGAAVAVSGVMETQMLQTVVQLSWMEYSSRWQSSLTGCRHAQVRRVCPNAAFVLQLMRWQRIACRPEAWRWTPPTVSSVKVGIR